MRQKQWLVDGNDYHLVEEGNYIKRLDPGVYILHTTIVGGFYLTKVSDKFSFPYKIYGKDQAFIDRVVKTFAMTKTNLGVLLNGTKGTGKTVTAELLANALEIPVILVMCAFSGLASYLNTIQQDVTVLIDEYEKVYKDEDKDKESLLSVMDGVLNTRFRKVFLLTTNRLYISDNMLERPSRIRYHKTYGDLPLEIIMEVVDDLLAHKEHREETVSFISGLEIITMDIVKSVIQEVNIHNESPAKFKDVFNVRSMDVLKNVYVIAGEDDKGLPIERKWQEEVTVHPARITLESAKKRESFKINGNSWGKITKVVGYNKIEVERTIDVSKDDEPTRYENRKTTYRIETVLPVHSSFKGGDTEF